MKSLIKIATRSSKLALWQANYIKEKINFFFPDLKIELVEIKTKGDHILDVALSQIGDKGLFTKEIEESILKNETDLAVHSLKDLPTKLPAGLKLGAVLKREKAHDVLILKDKSKGADVFKKLLSNSKIGTSSLRRIAQLKSIRPDLEYIDLRGNLDTRIKKLQEGQYGGIVLAYAGVKRLGFEDLISYHFNPEEILPAVSQGAIGIEIRENDFDVEKIILKLNDEESFLCTSIERDFLRTLEGGCQIPIGAYSKIEKSKITLHGLIASLDGKKIVRDSLSEDLKNSNQLGNNLAELLLRNGGYEIVKSFHSAKIM